MNRGVKAKLRNMSKLSVTMAVGLAEAIERGGVLVYWAGGFWTVEGSPVKHVDSAGFRVPDWYITSGTVQALQRRDHVKVLELRERRGRHGKGSYPVKAQLFAERQETDDAG